MIDAISIKSVIGKISITEIWIISRTAIGDKEWCVMYTTDQLLFKDSCLLITCTEVIDNFF